MKIIGAQFHDSCTKFETLWPSLYFEVTYFEPVLSVTDTAYILGITVHSDTIMSKIIFTKVYQVQVNIF